MVSKGRHAAPRTNSRKTRLFGRAVPLALALVMAMGAVAWADHTVSLRFSLTEDGASVTSVQEGTGFFAIYQTDRTQGNVKLFQCFVRDPETGITDLTQPTAVAVCGTPSNLENAPAAAAEGEWKEVNAHSGTAPKAFGPVATTGLGGRDLGFGVQHPPLEHAGGGTQIDFADISVIALTGNGDHPGCKGVENAYDQVTTNNGAAKGNGKGKAALEKVAEKLGCDLGGE